jgi:hypothetical protein
MAKIEVEQLLLQLDANLTKYEKALAKATGVTVSQMRKIERQVEQSATRVERTFSRMGAALKGFAIGAIGGLGIENIVRVITQTVNAAADLGDTADKIGITAEQLQQLGFAAKQSGADMESLQKGLVLFSKNVGQAVQGQGDLLELFELNGVALKDSEGKLRPINDLLMDFANLVRGAKNPTEALAVATTGMGKAGAELVTTLANGSDGLAQLGQQAALTGNVIEESLIRRAQVMDDKFDSFTDGALTRFKSGLLSGVVAVQDMVTWVDNLSESLTRLSGVKVDVGGSIGGALRTLPGLSGLMAGKDLLLGPNVPAVPPGEAGTQSNAAGKGNKETVLPDARAKKAAADATRDQARAERELNAELQRNQEAFFDDLKSLRERTDAIRLEAQTLGLSTAEMEKARAAQELLNSAREHGIEVTPGVSQAINELAASYGDAAQALEDLQLAESKAADINESAKDNFKSFVSDIRAGVAPVDALTSALDRLADKLLDLALDNALDGLLGSNSKGGGGLGAMIASIFHGGGIVGTGGRSRSVSPAAFVGARRMHGGGLAGDEVPAILQRGETVLPRGFKAGRQGGGMKVTVNDYAGVRVTPQKRRDEFGREELYVEIDRRIADPYSGASVALGARGARNPVKRR